MSKIIKLGHIVLDPNLLFGEVDAIATVGKVHAHAITSFRHEGQDYANASTPDVLVGKPQIAQKARELWELMGQFIADETGAPVEWQVAGAVRTFTPSSK